MTENSSQNILSEDLSVNHIVSDRIQSITKWSRFLGIVGVIFLGFFLLIMLVAGTQLSQMGSYFPGFAQVPAAILIVAAVLVAAVIGVLVFYLLRFATLTKRAIQLRNQEMLNKGLEALKIYFAIYAVLAILGVCSTLLQILNLL
jgi:uncharacterized integral membrane protein